MGKRLPKVALLAENELERGRLLNVLKSAPDRELTRRGRNDAGWSIKDVLAHVYDWENRGVDWWEAGRRGEAVNPPDPDYNWGEIRALNQQIFRSHRRESLATVLENFREAHRRTLAALNDIDDEELTTLGFAAWTGQSWTLSDYFRANTASHYRWATKKIRRWLS